MWAQHYTRFSLGPGMGYITDKTLVKKEYVGKNREKENKSKINSQIDRISVRSSGSSALGEQRANLAPDVDEDAEEYDN